MKTCTHEQIDLMQARVQLVVPAGGWTLIWDIGSIASIWRLFDCRCVARTALIWRMLKSRLVSTEMVQEGSLVHAVVNTSVADWYHLFTATCTAHCHHTALCL